MRRRALIPAVGSHNRKTFSDAGLSASDFLDRIAALIPPPRKHRHCYFWVLAPNSPLWALVTAYAGRQLVAGSKAPRPNTVRVVAGATRAGQGVRYLWEGLPGANWYLTRGGIECTLYEYMAL